MVGAVSLGRLLLLSLCLVYFGVGCVGWFGWIWICLLLHTVRGVWGALFGFGVWCGVWIVVGLPGVSVVVF